jgi:hypothetical protein
MGASFCFFGGMGATFGFGGMGATFGFGGMGATFGLGFTFIPAAAAAFLGTFVSLLGGGCPSSESADVSSESSLPCVLLSLLPVFVPEGPGWFWIPEKI